MEHLEGTLEKHRREAEGSGREVGTEPVHKATPRRQRAPASIAADGSRLTLDREQGGQFLALPRTVSAQGWAQERLRGESGGDSTGSVAIRDQKNGVRAREWYAVKEASFLVTRNFCMWGCRREGSRKRGEQVMQEQSPWALGGDGMGACVEALASGRSPAGSFYF